MTPTNVSIVQGSFFAIDFVKISPDAPHIYLQVKSCNRWSKQGKGRLWSKQGKPFSSQWISDLIDVLERARDNLDSMPTNPGGDGWRFPEKDQGDGSES